MRAVTWHEPMGVVEEVGSEVKDIAPGDRVVMVDDIMPLLGDDDPLKP